MATVNVTPSIGGGGNPAAGPTGSPVPANADYQGINVGGNLVGATGFTAGSTTSQAVSIVDASGIPLTVFPVTGSLSITASTLPTITQDDDKQYDDDGFPFFNPNVPGADISTGDKQTQIINLLSSLPLHPVSVQGGVTVANFPSIQAVSQSSTPWSITGTVATSLPVLPTVTQDDDKQYDDDGYPYFNPNVPSADIATGDKQTQILNLLSSLPAHPVSILGTSSVAVTNFPGIIQNPALEIAGNLQRIADTEEAVLAELRVIAIALSQLSQPIVDAPEQIRNDLNLLIQ